MADTDYEIPDGGAGRRSIVLFQPLSTPPRSSLLFARVCSLVVWWPGASRANSQLATVQERTVKLTDGFPTRSRFDIDEGVAAGTAGSAIGHDRCRRHSTVGGKQLLEIAGGCLPGDIGDINGLDRLGDVTSAGFACRIPPNPICPFASISRV